jgi:hypothetical protein
MVVFCLFYREWKQTLLVYWINFIKLLVLQLSYYDWHKKVSVCPTFQSQPRWFGAAPIVGYLWRCSWNPWWCTGGLLAYGVNMHRSLLYFLLKFILAPDVKAKGHSLVWPMSAVHATGHGAIRTNFSSTRKTVKIVSTLRNPAKSKSNPLTYETETRGEEMILLVY